MKLRYKIIILVESVFLACILFVACLDIITDLSEPTDTNFFNETSPDEQYRISADYKGKNSWCEYWILLTIHKENDPKKSEDDRETYMKLVVDTGDDTFPNKENFKCEWYEDYVTITFINNQGKTASSFRLYWDDLNFDHDPNNNSWSFFE